MSDNIPANAIAISFHYGSQQGKFYTWPVKGGKYYWSALGNNGEADTLDKAMSSARSWILFNNTVRGDK